MKISANSVQEYLENIPEETKVRFGHLRQVIVDNLPSGFQECLNYGMIGYVVPHELYPEGYHCDASLPLPFLNIAVQKNFIAFYHMGIYANESLYEWFVKEYPKHCDKKLDMGKSCIRFKKATQIPYELIGYLVSKMTVDDWVNLYENSRDK